MYHEAGMVPGPQQQGGDGEPRMTKGLVMWFEFDFTDVYWNPRLSTEHSRVIDLLRDGDVLYDVFAGVGPFAIPAARKGCTVIANDLNPHSYTWLNHNVTLNKVSDRVTTYNMDGREFIQKVMGETLVKHLADDKHVHGEEGVTGAKQKVEDGLGRPVERDVQVSFVRNVAPNKDMMRASFDLSLNILCALDCSPAKRCKVEEEAQGTQVGVVEAE
ncbi:hypothetical protein HPB49_003342 [Dermacentor silvarum]|uniref:Uncharacterized protein n=1 Tax=Dermacentor silvarum TaxID=543639 RepID=A0ACB8C0V4_DERSI|nr:hypothetical protein HPB49_003342 [Dermacentor silvarum]